MRSLLLTFFLYIIMGIFSANAKEAPASFADIVDKLMPAVVNISTVQTLESSNNPLVGGNNPDMPIPFDNLPDLFEKFYGEDGGSQKRKDNSLGSGFIIDKDGYIVTNYHVIDGAEKITITFSDDTKLDAKIIGKDKKTDIALLKVETKKELPFVKFGNSSKARVGDWVIAIGNPYGLGGSVSSGIISARARDINAGPFDDFIQTDAAINRGNSGGPLFNIDGEVIGINSAIFSPSGGNIGIGFAVPSELVWPIIDQLKTTGKTERGWIGVKIQTVTEEIAESLNIPVKGALVIEVTKDGPADKAGLKSGDIIMEFDGKEVAQMRKLPRIVAETSINKKVPVIVMREGVKKTFVITVALLNEEEDTSKLAKNSKNDNTLDAGAKNIIGIDLLDINDDVINKYKLKPEDKNGVLISNVKKESDAFDKGLRRGDIIISINQKSVINASELINEIKDSQKKNRKYISLLIKRSDERQFVAVSITEKE